MTPHPPPPPLDRLPRSATRGPARGSRLPWRRGPLDGLRVATAGVLRCVSSQRNMKLHTLAALMVCIVGMALPLPTTTRVSWLFAIALVFFAEVLNTALEAIVDLYIGEFHRLAMLAKDAAAGGVLILATATGLVFADTLWSEWRLVLEHPAAVGRSVLLGVPLIALEAVGLFYVRRGRWARLRLLTALLLLLPLVAHSTDPVFAGLAVILLGMTHHARSAFPRQRGRGAPARDASPARRTGIGAQPEDR